MKSFALQQARVGVGEAANASLRRTEDTVGITLQFPRSAAQARVGKLLRNSTTELNVVATRYNAPHNVVLSSGFVERSIKAVPEWEVKEGMTLAAIDLGTYSFHMVVVKATSEGQFYVIDQMKERVDLLEGSGTFNVIAFEAKDRAMAALKRLIQVAETKEAALRVLATSAIREARNGSAFVRHVKTELGINVEVISGQEEARLMYTGILQALPIFNCRALCIDIGGGSSELVLGVNGAPLIALSLKLGHLRLRERCFKELAEDGTFSLEEVEECRRYIRAALADSGVKDEINQNTQGKGIDVAVGSSGVIETVGGIARRAARATTSSSGANDLDEVEFSVEQLAGVVRTISKARTREARQKLKGLSQKRVDNIVPGVILLQEIFELFGIKQMRVSPCALREGMIVDTLARALPAYKPPTDIRSSSIRHLASRFAIENRMQSSMHSGRLAREILEGLLHGDHVPAVLQALDENDAFLLYAGVALHHVGMFVSHSSHHKHAYYIIKNDEHLLGFSPMEVEVIALLARYHRKAYPSHDADLLAGMSREWRNKVCILVAIARLAIALDRRNTANAVRSIQVIQDADGCVIVVHPATNCDTGEVEDVSLELWAVRQELEFLSQMIGKSTMVVEGTSEQEGIFANGSEDCIISR